VSRRCRPAARTWTRSMRISNALSTNSVIRCANCPRHARYANSMPAVKHWSSTCKADSQTTSTGSIPNRSVWVDWRPHSRAARRAWCETCPQPYSTSPAVVSASMNSNQPDQRANAAPDCSPAETRGKFF
jgi:hypothetical protein